MAIGADIELLARPQLEAIAHTYEEQLFPAGQRVLRRGMSGSGLQVVLDGEARVVLESRELARLGRGEFFGDVSALLDTPPTADVVAETPLRRRATSHASSRSRTAPETRVWSRSPTSWTRRVPTRSRRR